jgi:hypothetical protein
MIVIVAVIMVVLAGIAGPISVNVTVVVIVLVLMDVARPVGMNVFMHMRARRSIFLERRNGTGDAGLEVEQRRLGVVSASACRAHQPNSSISMLLMFNSWPLSR